MRTLFIFLSFIFFEIAQSQIYRLSQPDKVDLSALSKDSICRYSDYPYLTAKISISAPDITLSSKEFRGKWYKKIEGIYIAASVENIYSSGNINVPLFSIDLKSDHPQIQTVENYNIINKIAYRKDNREIPYIYLKSQIIVSNYKDFNKILSYVSTILSNNTINSVVSGSAVGTALNTITGLASSLFPVTENPTDINVAVSPPTLFDNQSSAKLYIIIPPYQTKDSLFYMTQIKENTYYIRFKQNGQIYAALKKNNEFNEYFDLPYLIVQYIPSFYVSDIENLFPEQFLLASITDAQISKVKSFLTSSKSTQLLTEQQHKYEDYLLTLIEEYQQFTEILKNIKGAKESDEKLDLIKKFMNELIDYEMKLTSIQDDTTSLLYVNKYKERCKNVVCEINKLVTNNSYIPINLLKNYNTFRLNYSIAEVKNNSGKQDTCLNLMYDIQRSFTFNNKPLTGTILYDWSVFEITKLEHLIYRQRFQDSVQRITYCSGSLSDLVEIEKVLKTRLLITECTKCRDSLQFALNTCSKLTSGKLTVTFNNQLRDLSVKKFEVETYLKSPSILNISKEKLEQFTFDFSSLSLEINQLYNGLVSSKPVSIQDLNTANTDIATLLNKIGTAIIKYKVG